MLDALQQAFPPTRTALPAGVAWLLAGWIALRSHIDPAASHSPTAQVIGRLATIFGQAGGLIALLLLALFTGALSLHIFRAPAMWIGNASVLFVKAFEDRFLRTFDDGNEQKLRRYRDWAPVPVDVARRVLSNHEQEISQHTGAVNPMFRSRVYAAADLAVIRLTLDESTADPAIAHREFDAAIRYAVTMPLLVLALVCTVDLTPLFAILIAAPFILSFQAAEYKSFCVSVLEPLVWAKVDLDEVARIEP